MEETTSNEVKQETTTNQKPVEGKNSKNKSRKKEVRNVEALLKSMSNLSTEEKLQAFTQKYAELLEENRSGQAALKTNEKNLQIVLKEKEQLQLENGKSLLARSRLEELCRELQRQNKAIKEESVMRLKEEEERRKQVSTKFQSTLSEVSTLLQQNNDKNQKLKDENTEMAQKLQLLCDQYSLREQHLDKLGKQYDIERQLNEAKIAKLRMETAEMKEKMLLEKQHLLQELTEYQKRCQAMQKEEVSLRQQLLMYTEKYDDFQKALKTSNQQFDTFKTQMDEMTKKLKRLEKETAQWKQRWEKSNATLLEMATEKKQRDGDLINASKQISQLEKLCRALQAERTVLLNQIKGTVTPSGVDVSPDESPKLSAATSNDPVLTSTGNPSGETNSVSEVSHHVDEKPTDNDVESKENAVPVDANNILKVEALTDETAAMTIENAAESTEQTQDASVESGNIGTN